jgi:effector-binding domain-containing protein
MPYDVRVTEVTPRQLAAVREEVSDIGERVGALLGEVWAVLKPHGTRTGHNVVVYDRVWQDERGRPCFDARFGVEVLGDFPANERVVATQTPGGRVATTVHWGPYDGLAAAFQVVHEWCARNGYTVVGPGWEVYGDWSEDPSRLRTDVFVALGD